MQPASTVVSELEISSVSPISFMKRLNTVLTRLNWRLVDSEFETIEICVPRLSTGHGELYIELDDEKALVRYHISGSNSQENVAEELSETIALFKQEYESTAPAFESEVQLSTVSLN